MYRRYRQSSGGDWFQGGMDVQEKYCIHVFTECCAVLIAGILVYDLEVVVMQ